MELPDSVRCGEPRWLGALLVCRSLRSAPDGQWAATSPWRSNVRPVGPLPKGKTATDPSLRKGVRIWRTSDGKLERELPSDETAGVAFASDGRLLVLGTDGSYRTYAANTFEEQVHRTDPLMGFARGLKVAFHPDGRTIAHTHDRVGLRLADLETGETPGCACRCRTRTTWPRTRSVRTGGTSRRSRSGARCRCGT